MSVDVSASHRIAADAALQVARDSAGIFGVGFGIISKASSEIFQAVAQSRGLTGNSPTDQLISLYSNITTQYGGAMYRLAQTGRLRNPGFSMTLQRFADLESSNAGLLTIGGLPSGISNDSMTVSISSLSWILS